ncbi:MAG TPA: GDSL-type esterase/lipase family protein [Dehalococcoidia bacterium]|nr:GDSL-type esterase/lipase family protein [Dehalococcoidia bacterium]
MASVKRVAAIGALLGGSLCVAAAIAEVAVRLLASAGAPIAREVAALDPYAIKIEPHGAFGYRQRAGAVLKYPNGTRATANAEGFRGPEVAVPKPAGAFRVELFGESSTHGWYVDDDQTIDAYLRAELASERPDLHVDVVNLAYDGYDVYQMWQRLLDDGVRFQPDVIVVNAGVNDVHNARFRGLRGDPDPRTLIWEADLQRLRQEQATGGPTLWTRIKHLSYLARLPGIVRGSLRRRSAADSTVHGPYPEAADNFQRNVERMADVAGRLGVPLLLSTPPSALLLPDAPKRMPPRSYWLADAAATQRYRDTLAARLRQIAARRTAAGQRVVYLAPKLPGRLFLDDVHLTAEGNRAMAEAFATAIRPYLPPKR